MLLFLSDKNDLVFFLKEVSPPPVIYKLLLNSLDSFINIVLKILFKSFICFDFFFFIILLISFKLSLNVGALLKPIIEFLSLMGT